MVDGFSSMNPRLARGPQISAGEATKRRRSVSRKAPTPTVRIAGNTVFINNQGFSVAPSLQASFIQNRTGGRGSSAQAAISNAIKIEAERKRQATLRNQEMARLDKLKQDVARSQFTASEKSNLNKRIEQERRATIFRADIRSGKIQGVSGIGLSPSEFQKRKLLIQLGVLNEKSSIATLRNAAPLMNEYFIDTKPTTTDKGNFINHLKSNAFSTALVLTPKPQLNAMQRIAARMNTTVKSLTKTNNKNNIIRLNSSMKSNRAKLLQLLRMNNLLAQKTGREAMLFSLYLSKTFFGLAGAGWNEIKKQYSISKILGKKVSGMGKGELLAMQSIAAAKLGKNVWSVAKGSVPVVKKIVANPKASIKATWKTSVVVGKVTYRFGKMVIVETGKDLWATGKLLFVHPGLAVAKIGVDIFIMKGTGKVFTVAGKLTKVAARPFVKAFSPIKKIKIRVKSPLAYMTKDVGKIKARISELEKFRIGALNAAYLKAKNAQFGSGVRGTTKSYGSVSKLTPEQITVISRGVAKKGLTRGQILEGSFYRQQIRVRSLVPKYEAHLKWIRAKLAGNKKVKLGKFSKYYVFTRYGIVVSSTQKGVTKAVAVEFNKVGGKISHIGFKSAISKGDKALVTIFKKARRVKGIPTRVKIEGMFLVKNKISTTESGGKGLIRILNTLETKKVFLGGKKLPRAKLLDLKIAIKQSVRSGRRNLDKFLNGLWRDDFLTGRSGITNTIQLKRIGKGFEKVKVKILKKGKPVTKPKIYIKGQYVEIGHTQFRIPTRKVLKVGKKKPIKRIKKIKIKRRGEIITPKRMPKVRTVSSPSIKLKIKPKKGLSKLKTRQLERAVKSIQTITRPTTRRVGRRKVMIKTKVISKVAVKKLSRTISSIIPLVAVKNISALRVAQANLNDSIKATSSLHKSKLKNEAVKILKTISMPKSFLAITQPIKPRAKAKIIRPRKKPLIGIPLPKGKRKKKVLKKRKDFGYTSSVKRKVAKKLIRIPLTKKRALDILAYSLDRSTASRGRTIKSVRKQKLSVLKRQMKSIPVGYFVRNRKKFTLRRLKKGRETYEMIEKKKFRKDKKTERRVKRKRGIPRYTRRKRVVKKIRRKK